MLVWFPRTGESALLLQYLRSARMILTPLLITEVYPYFQVFPNFIPEFPAIHIFRGHHCIPHT